MQPKDELEKGLLAELLDQNKLLSDISKFQERLQQSNWDAAVQAGPDAGISLALWLVATQKGRQLLANNPALQNKLLQSNWDAAAQEGSHAGKSVAWWLVASPEFREQLRSSTYLEKLVEVACQPNSSITPDLIQKLNEEVVFKRLMLANFQGLEATADITNYRTALRETLDRIAEFYRGYYQEDGMPICELEVLEMLGGFLILAEHPCFRYYSATQLSEIIRPLMEKHFESVFTIVANRLVNTGIRFFENKHKRNRTCTEEQKAGLIKKLLQTFSGKLMTQEVKDEALYLLENLKHDMDFSTFNIEEQLGAQNKRVKHES